MVRIWGSPGGGRGNNDGSIGESGVPVTSLTGSPLRNYLLGIFMGFRMLHFSTSKVVNILRTTESCKALQLLPSQHALSFDIYRGKE